MIVPVILLVLAACWPTCVLLHDEWTNWSATTYTHGYLIAAVCAFLLWRTNRSSTPCSPDRSSWLALVALFGSGLIWAIGVRSGLVAVQWLLFPVLLILAIRAALGPFAARRNVFAIAYLYFALPLWGSANALFQWATVFAVRGMLRMVGIPSHFVENTVQIPAGTFEIAGGCSGLHFVMVGFAIAALMGELRHDHWRSRVKLLVLAGALAVVTNWVRVFTIILAGHYSHMQSYLVARSHYGYGWALFAVAMLVFFLLERRMALLPEMPEITRPVSSDSPGARVQWEWVSGVAVVMVAVASLQWLSARPSQAPPVATVSSEWSPAVDQYLWQPVVEGADIHDQQVYISARGEKVYRHAYLFLNQRQGKELGGYADDLAGGAAPVYAGKMALGGLLATRYEVSDMAGVHWLVAVSYGTGGRSFASPVPAQLRYALVSMARLRSQPSTITVWRVSCLPDCAAAEAVLGRFVTAMEVERFP